VRAAVDLAGYVRPMVVVGWSVSGKRGESARAQSKRGRSKKKKTNS
jgi:hypothetical protein